MPYIIRKVKDIYHLYKDGKLVESYSSIFEARKALKKATTKEVKEKIEQDS